MGKIKHITVGEKFGKLVYLAEAGFRNGERFITARCDCGRQKEYRLTYLRTGHTASCGCLLAEKNKERATHGHTRKGVISKGYSCYRDMRTRCENPNYKEFYLYGGRGITVCERWRKGYEFFLEDMGTPPIGLTLERNDVNGEYSKENCRWTTTIEQANNKRNSAFIEFNGKKQTVIQWARELGIKAGTIYFRRQRGYSAEAALSPVAAPTKRIIHHSQDDDMSTLVNAPKPKAPIITPDAGNGNPPPPTQAAVVVGPTPDAGNGNPPPPTEDAVKIEPDAGNGNPPPPTED